MSRENPQNEVETLEDTEGRLGKLIAFSERFRPELNKVKPKADYGKHPSMSDYELFGHLGAEDSLAA